MSPPARPTPAPAPTRAPTPATVPGPVPLLGFGEVTSTNDVALAEGRARAAELGALGGVPALAVRADRQSAGRGRAGRAWESPGGSGLYLSIYLRPVWPPAQAGWLTLAAALAVRDACIALLPRRAAPPALKWPNDLLAGDGSGRKLGGILVESRTQKGVVGEAVIGLGLNLRPPVGGFPASLVPIAAALDEVAGPAGPPTPDALAQAVLARLGSEIATLGGDPVAAARSLVARAREASPLWGRPVAFERDGRIVRGIARTWANDGGLAVELAGGDLLVVHAGDVLVQWGSAS